MTDFQNPTPAPDIDSSSQGTGKRPSTLRAIWEIAEVLALAVLMVMLIRNFVQNYRIDGVSMEPNFHDQQFLIVNRWAYCPGLHVEVPVVNVELWSHTWCVRQPQRGDVVIFEYPRDPSRDFIKRVIGLPGETVQVQAGRVYVDGQVLSEPFGPNPGSYTSDPVTVGPDEVFVMGDNRNNSSDSHLWGPLPQDRIIGKALVSYWPPRYWSVVPRYNLTDLSAAGAQ